jgi:hypothetical protein
MSYRAAAPRADGNSVADWVEIFAPVVFARAAPASWPRTVVIDSLPFRVRLPRDIPAFQIFGALDPEAGLVSLQAFPGAHPGAATALWEAFLRSREGVPTQVVCDPDPDLLAAIENVWTPAPLTSLCQTHLRVELRDLLREEGINRGEPIANAGERAFDGPVQWREFVEFHRPRRLRKLERWVARHDEQIGRQLDRAEPSEKTTDLLEQKLGLLGDLFSGRRGNLRNRERTNRLLMLVQLELNGLADKKRYARIIEEELLARGGRANPRRAIVDPTGSSLRP